MKTPSEQRLLEIIKAKSVRKGHFTLASGATSTFYLDLKPTAFDSEGAALIGAILVERLKAYPDAVAVGGLELGAVPIVTSVTLASWPERPIAAFVVRKKTKDHGTAQAIDGNFTPGSSVVLIDDVTTKGGSVMQAVEAVRANGATVLCVMSLVDRQEGARENLGKAGVELVSIFTTPDVLG